MKNWRYIILILFISVFIPILVAILFLFPKAINISIDVSFLPHLHGICNILTVICLGIAFGAIKNKQIHIHRFFMILAFFISICFLISYVVYHSQGELTLYGDLNQDNTVSLSEKNQLGFNRYIYYFVLISHIALSSIVVPFVLFSFYFILSHQVSKHKKWVKWAYPIWMYVAASGVAVYLMLQPYY